MAQARRGHGGTPQPSVGRTYLELLGAGMVAAVVLTVLISGFAVFVAFEQERWSLGYWGSLVALLLLVFGLWAVVVDAPLGLLRAPLRWPAWLVRTLRFVALVPAAALGLALAGELSGEQLIVWSVVLVLPAFAFVAISDFVHPLGERWWVGPVVWGGMLAVAAVVALVGGLQIPGAVG